MTRLLSVGPETPSDDEQVIAKGYTSKGPVLAAIVIIALAIAFGNVKTVIGVGLVVMVILGFFIEGRLHDLCIRVRRANILLNQLCSRSQ